MKSLKPLFGMMGSKMIMAGKIVGMIPPHATYVEVFGGTGAVLLAKDPMSSMMEVYNDLNSAFVNFYRVLRDPEKFERIRHMIEYTPYSREEWRRCRREWRAEPDDVKRAWAWYVMASQSFSGFVGQSWGFTVGVARQGMSLSVARFVSRKATLGEVHKRMERVQVENDDFRKVIATYDREGTFFYLDPPYVPETRRHGEYEHEMSAADHEELVDILLGLKGQAILSGYPNPIYERLEGAGWSKEMIDVPCWGVAKTKASGLMGEGGMSEQYRTEALWSSPVRERRGQLDLFGKG